MIRTVAFESYRSLHDLKLGLGQLTVVTGANGAGKTNVYRGLKLLADAARGELGRALALEGGLGSALWAGPGRVKDYREGLHAPARTRRSQGTRNTPVRMSVGYATEDWAYELRLGLPSPSTTLFGNDPEVKAETLRLLSTPKVHLLERRATAVVVRDRDGSPVTVPALLDLGESVMAQLAEPHRYPTLSILREGLLRWRFYHQIRTDPDSPVRQAQIATRTPILAHDARDLAAALRTIQENGDGPGLATAVADGLDGARVEVTASGSRFGLLLHTPGVLRPLAAAELSDGTLRFLALLAALLSPRPPPLLVLNEPEQSLHVRLYPALARRIAASAAHTQIVVVSHATALVEALAEAGPLTTFELYREEGATQVVGRNRLEEPVWRWTD